MRIDSHFLLVGLASLVLGGQAQAGICVKVDEERDNLGADIRKAATSLLSNALEEEGEVLGEPCSETFTVSHVQLGSSITVRLSNDSDARSMTASSLEELPRVYSQLLGSMLHDVPLEEGVNRSNVTRDQAEPVRVASEYKVTLRFGVTGSFVGSTLAPTVGFGMRTELDRWAIEAAGSGFLNETKNGMFGGLNAHLNGLRFKDPKANHTPYLGAGVGYGGQSLSVGNNDDEGHGFEGHIFGGYEFLRASTIRMFGQVDVVLPAYTLHDRWAPLVGMSFAIGYDPPPKSGNTPPLWWFFTNSSVN
jgi:hypothetical protein